MSATPTPGSPIPSMPSTTALQPTWDGFVSDTRDALILFEATINGTLSRVVRRPHDRERTGLIKSGSVFIYEESASGIKRWTDGFPWSPSRILNNFLIYRELERPFPPGEKKRAAKKPKGSPASSRPGEPYPRRGSDEPRSPTATSQVVPNLKSESSSGRDDERSLVGSLTDSYPFKEDGLVKKAISVTVDTVHYGLVSYYNPKEVQEGGLRRPTDDDRLRNIRIRSDLLRGQNFRAPLDDIEESVPISYDCSQVRNPYISSVTKYAPGLESVQLAAARARSYGASQQFQIPSYPSQNLYSILGLGVPVTTISHPLQGRYSHFQNPPYQSNPGSAQMPIKSEYSEYSPYQEQHSFIQQDQRPFNRQVERTFDQQHQQQYVSQPTISGSSATEQV